jgi:hypothetical protein
VSNANFLKSAATMLPVSIKNQSYALANQNQEYIIYTDTNLNLADLKLDKSSVAEWLGVSSGKIISSQKIDLKIQTLKKPNNGNAVLWIHKK